ncbi:MAG: HD domain-containing protein [Lachnospiraceae bacterium]|nr:HD domain-containing protein [Lachnospiraceae bacterium]
MSEKMISIEELDEGMLITADVYTRNGTILVPENTIATVEVINLLARHSIMEIIVGDGNDEAETNAEDLSVLDAALDMVTTMEEGEHRQETFEDTFRIAQETLEKSINRILNHEQVDTDQLLDIVDAIAAKADNDVHLFDMLFKMNQSSKDIYIHSINVSIYAQLLAKWMDLDEEEIELVGIAGLLHDMGLLVCWKEGEKNISLHGEYENTCGQNHMVHAYNLIKDTDVDIRLKQAILTHHERMDLSGFPHQLSYKSLNNVSRVLAIADAYDTLISKEEGYEAMAPLAALNYLFDNCYIKFDSEMLVCFIQRLVQNFIQFEVVLNDGQRGKIVMPNKNEPARPLIMVDGGFVDLSLRKDLSIKEMYY